MHSLSAGGTDPPLMPAHLLKQQRVTSATPFRSLIDDANLPALQAALERRDLWREVAILERLIYKNRSQHRSSVHFRRLLEVQRWLRLLRALRLPELLQLIHSLTQTPPLTSSAPAAKPCRNTPRSSDGTAWLPTRGAVFLVLTRLQGSCRAVAAVIPALRKAAAALLGQLAHSFFMPFCLTATAILARVQVLSAQMLLDSLRSYNALAELAALCPTFLSAEDSMAADLPESLAAEWSNGAPTLRPVTFPPGGSFATKSAELMEQYGMWVAVALDPAAAAVSQSSTAPSAASGCLPLESVNIGGSGGSLGQPLDRDAYRRMQEANAQQAAAVTPCAVVGKPQRVPRSVGSAQANPEPPRRQRPQPRARASDPLAVYDDKTRAATDGKSAGLDAGLDLVAAPQYERVNVALGGVKALSGGVAPASPLDDRGAGLAGCGAGVALAASDVRAGSPPVPVTPFPVGALAAMPITGEELEEAAPCQSASGHSQRDPAAAFRLPGHTLCPGSSSLSVLSAVQQDAELLPSAQTPPCAATIRDRAPVPGHSTASGEMGTAGMGADNKRGAPVCASDPASSAGVAQLPAQQQLQLPMPVDAGASPAAAAGLPLGDAAASGIAAGGELTRRQAQFMTLDNKRVRKKRRRGPSSADLEGVSTQVPDWADLLAPAPAQLSISTQQQSGSNSSTSNHRQPSPLKGTSAGASTLAPGGLLAPAVSRQSGMPSQQNRKMADIFSMLLNTE